MRAPFVSSVNWPGSRFPASPGRWAPAPTRCSSFCFYLGVIYRCAARNLSALAKGSLVHRVSPRRPPPPFQKPLASSQGRVTPKSRGVPGENAEGQKAQMAGWGHGIPPEAEASGNAGRRPSPLTPLEASLTTHARLRGRFPPCHTRVRPFPTAVSLISCRFSKRDNNQFPSRSSS